MLLIGIGLVAWFSDVLFEDWWCQTRYGRLVQYGCHTTWEDTSTIPLSYKAPLLKVTLVALLLASIAPWAWIISTQRMQKRRDPEN